MTGPTGKGVGMESACRQRGMAGRKRPRRAFSVDAYLSFLSLHYVLLEFRDVMANVVDNTETHAPLPQKRPKGFPDPVCYHLAVRKGVVGSSRHSRKIPARLGRMKGGAA